MDDTPETSRLPVDGCELHLEQAGAGAPVVFVHGAGAFAGLFRTCLEDLAASHRVIAYDRRGFARSTHPPVRRLARHVADLERLVRECCDEPPILVGWSAGATIALHLAAENPGIASSLVLAEPPLQLKAPRPAVLGPVVRWELAALTRGPRAGAEVFYRWVSQYRGTGTNAFDAYPDEVRETMLAHAPALLAEIRVGGGALGEWLRRRALAGLEIPVKVLLGTRSASMFAPAARYLVKVIPTAELVELPEASHMIPTDRPERIVQAVRALSGS